VLALSIAMSQKAKSPEIFREIGALETAFWSGRWESNPLFLPALSRKTPLLLVCS
jgi:hypothetical protein